MTVSGSESTTTTAIDIKGVGVKEIEQVLTGLSQLPDVADTRINASGRDDGASDSSGSDVITP